MSAVLEALGVLVLWAVLLELVVAAAGGVLAWLVVAAGRRVSAPRRCPDCHAGMWAIALWCHQRDPLRRRRCARQRRAQATLAAARIRQGTRPCVPAAMSLREFDEQAARILAEAGRTRTSRRRWRR